MPVGEVAEILDDAKTLARDIGQLKQRGLLASPGTAAVEFSCALVSAFA